MLAPYRFSTTAVSSHFIVQGAAAKYSKGNMEPPSEILLFPTVLGDKSYLNVVVGTNEKPIKNRLGISFEDLQ
jgi:hypothetical protein